MGIQDFGAKFSLEKYYRARDVARDMTYELAAMFYPGITEDEAHQMYKGLCLKYGVEKNWHPPKLRFGPNTLKNFKDVSEPWTLQDTDIFFIDIGPIVDGHEADFGETFSIGPSYEYKLICNAARKLFDEVSEFWKKNPIHGPGIYDFAQKRAQEMGYHLNLGSDGHRLGDFPHHLIFKGALLECNETVLPHAWILEIHLYSLDKKFGAFYEDILR